MTRFLTKHPFDDDRLHEECGVFGIYGSDDAAAHAALGLHALQHRGQESAGIVTFDGSQFHVHRSLGLVGEVFADRLRVKVREELGGAYSPGAGNNSSDTYRGYGYMIANVTVDPERAGEIADVVTAIAADLAANGVSEDELDRARQPILTGIRESVRTNGYWLGSVLAAAQEFPERLDWSRSRTADFQGITKAELDTLAKAYLGSNRAFRAVVLPAPAAAK